jgi:hypothetical protein
VEKLRDPAMASLKNPIAKSDVKKKIVNAFDLVVTFITHLWRKNHCAGWPVKGTHPPGPGLANPWNGEKPTVTSLGEPITVTAFPV